jgi:hypothetical protein
MFLQKALKILRSDVSRVVFAVAFLFIFLQALNAFAIWQSPTANPPDNNVAPPINVGSAEQIKQGKLSLLDTLTVTPSAGPSGFAALFDGMVGIGTISPVEKLHVKDGNIRVEGSATGAPYVNLNDGTQDGYLRLDPGSLTLSGETAGTNIRLVTNTADVEVRGRNLNVRLGDVGVGPNLGGGIDTTTGLPVPKNRGYGQGYVDGQNYWVREANGGDGAWVTDLTQNAGCSLVPYTTDSNPTGPTYAGSTCPSGMLAVGASAYNSTLGGAGTLICCTAIDWGTAMPLLVNNVHLESQCAAGGGTVVTDAGNRFCQFNLAACPATWTPYLNWHASGPTTCNGVTAGCPVGSGGTSCTAGHAWQNTTASDSCTYQLETDDGSGMGICNAWPTTCTATTSQIGCY